jgi:hypothetical protein
MTARQTALNETNQIADPKGHGGILEVKRGVVNSSSNARPTEIYSAFGFTESH